MLTIDTSLQLTTSDGLFDGRKFAITSSSTSITSSKAKLSQVVNVTSSSKVGDVVKVNTTTDTDETSKDKSDYEAKDEKTILKW